MLRALCANAKSLGFKSARNSWSDSRVEMYAKEMRKRDLLNEENEREDVIRPAAQKWKGQLTLLLR